MEQCLLLGVGACVELNIISVNSTEVEFFNHIKCGSRICLMMRTPCWNKKINVYHTKCLGIIFPHHDMIIKICFMRGELLR